MLILGIDPGSRLTGYAILESSDGSTRFIEGGVLVGRKANDFPHRLASIAGALEELLDRCRPDESAVEDVFHAVHARSALQLAHARGVILSTLARRGFPISEYTPLQIKKAVSGYGYAGKDALRELVERLLSIPPGSLTNDASDAVAVALCHGQAIPMRDALATARRQEDVASRQAPRGRTRVRRPRLIGDESP